MKTSLSSAFCMLLFAFGLHAQNTAKLNIAVNDLKGKGIPQSTAEILSDRLRSELINTGLFQVMETADAADTYNTCRNSDPALQSDNWNAYETNAQARNVLYGIAGAFAAGFALSMPF